MQIEVVIRQANLNDFVSVQNIFEDIVLNTTATFEERPPSLQHWKDVFLQKEKEHIPFFVAELNKQIIGYGSYGSFRKASGYRITAEVSLHVRSTFRGNGIGRKILEKLIESARQNNLLSLISAVDSENLASLALHEKFGFERVGFIPNVAIKFGRTLGLALLQKNLQSL